MSERVVHRMIGVLALGLGLLAAAIGTTSVDASAAAAASGRPMPPARPRVISANLLGNGGFELPALGRLPYTTMPLGTRLGVCRLNAIAPVPAGCWSVAPTDDVDIIGTYWRPFEGQQSLDLSGVQGSYGRISQSFTPVPGASSYQFRYAQFHCGCGLRELPFLIRVVWGDRYRVLGRTNFFLADDGPDNTWTASVIPIRPVPGATWGMVTFQDLLGRGVGIGLDAVAMYAIS